MRYNKSTMLIPYALLLSIYTTVTPAYKDNSTRSGPCVEGGPNNAARQSYDYRILHRSNNIAALRPYLNDKLATLFNDASRDNNHQELLTNDPFSSRIILPGSARVASTLAISDRDARNIPLRVDLERDDQSWQDEVLMIQGGQCWVVDDVRHLSGSVHAMTGTLRQPIESR